MQDINNNSFRNNNDRLQVNENAPAAAGSNADQGQVRVASFLSVMHVSVSLF